MDPLALYHAIRDRGARVWVDGPDVVVEPGHVLDDALRAQIRACKPALRALLIEHAAGAKCQSCGRPVIVLAEIEGGLFCRRCLEGKSP
jgi:hypothetical protein